MSAFRIAPVFHDFFAVYHGERRVGIIFPARPALAFPPAPAEPWTLAPDPEAFPDLACSGLPSPMEPYFQPFDSLDAIRSYLGIPEDAREEMAA